MKKLLILSLSLYLFACHNRNDRPAMPTGQEGKPLPSFDVLLSDSSTRLNTADIPKGKPIVLLYLSPACPFCRAELSSILKNMSALSDTRFYVFTNWPFRQFKNFYKHYQLYKYKNIVAGQDYANAFATHYPLPAVPFTAFYDKNKNLDKAFIGLMPIEQIKSLENKNSLPTRATF
jgi:thiol-disulfide isomerase/thioredoxin